MELSFPIFSMLLTVTITNTNHDWLDFYHKRGCDLYCVRQYDDNSNTCNTDLNQPSLIVSFITVRSFSYVDHTFYGDNTGRSLKNQILIGKAPSTIK